MSSSQSTSYRDALESLLAEKDVIVLTKTIFFQTVNFLFQFAQVPRRRSWEFFSYRPWEYILGTWCAIFGIKGFAISCGAQHPFIYRLLKKLHYVLPDYVLLSHSDDGKGGEEDRLVMIVEIKALGNVEADTAEGRRAAASIFTRTWEQRTNQARLAFRDHPTQQEVSIVMVSGPWFAVYTWEPSKLGASPPEKRWRRGGARTTFRTDEDSEEELPTISHRVGPATTPAGQGEEKRRRSLRTNNKRKREPSLVVDSVTTQVTLNHVLQLGPNGGEALNPWFLHFLGHTREALERVTGKLSTQNSWFDWPTGTMPEGDGHVEGFVLPESKPTAASTDDDVDDVVRLDEDLVVLDVPVDEDSVVPDVPVDEDSVVLDVPVDEDWVVPDRPSTPGDARKTLSAMQLNAMMSPKLQTPRVFRDGTDDVLPAPPHVPQRQRVGMPLAQHPEAQSVDSASGTDDDATLKAQRSQQSQGLPFRRQDRELSPSAAYVERRQHGPVNPLQFYPAPPDSSPPRSTPPRPSWPDDERDSESLTGYHTDTPDPAMIPRPASAPPTPSSPPSRTSQSTTPAHSVSRGHQSRTNNPLRQERVIRPIPLSRTAQPPRPYQPLRPFQKGALVRPLTRTTNDRELASIARETATEDEWERRPPTADELLMHALNGERGADRVRDYMQGYRKAGMNEEQAARACEQYLRLQGRSHTQPGENPPSGPSVASGSRSTTATVAVPPAPSRRPATHISSSGEGPSHWAPSGVKTGAPTPTHAAARAGSSSRRPPVDGASVARMASLDGGDSELLDGDFPDDEAQVNRLAEKIRTLSITNVPGNAGDPRWDNPSLGTLFVFGELARKSREDLRQVFRNAGMDARQVENAYERYMSQVRGKLNVWDLLLDLVASDGAATTRIDAPSAARPVEGQRREATE